MNSTLTILVAEDDANDVFLLKRAFTRLGGANVQIVANGEEAINYICGSGIYSDRGDFPFPDCLILDLRMPKKGGLEVLEWLHVNPECHVIPTIIYTSSQQPEDIKRAYQLGANTYFVKPNDFDILAKRLEIIFTYWEFAEKPPKPRGAEC
jgi:CheY-like chemotaxis protein